MYVSFINIKHNVILRCFTSGTYVCKKCNNLLFPSGSKYKHDTPWPGFTKPMSSISLVKRKENDMAYKVIRVETNMLEFS